MQGDGGYGRRLVGVGVEGGFEAGGGGEVGGAASPLREGGSQGWGGVGVQAVRVGTAGEGEEAFEGCGGRHCGCESTDCAGR